MRGNRKIYLILLTVTAILLALACTIILLEPNVPEQSQGEIFNFSQVRSLLTISTNRLSIVDQYCGSQLISISDSDRSKNDGYRSAVSTYMTANQTTLVVKMVNSEWGNAVTELQSNGIGTFVFISPFIIGLILLFVVTPCLVCCCCCQQCCPSKCCRGKNPNYSRDELTWPTAFLLISALVLIGAAVPSMTNNKAYFADFNCQASKLFDNWKNGGQTANQLNFFSGIIQVQNQLTNVMKPQISNIRTQVARLKPTAATVMEKTTADINTIITDIKSLPNGVDDAQFTQTYDYPLESSTSTATFSTILGPKIGQFDQPTSLLGDLYQYLGTIQTKLTSIATESSVESQITDSSPTDLGGSIANADIVLTTVQDSLEVILSDIETGMSYTETFDTYAQQYSLVLFGSILGCGIAVILGIVFLKCLKVLCCRHLIYLVCILIFFLCLLLFIYAIALSILMTSMHYSCTYLEESFTSPTKFIQTITDTYQQKHVKFKTVFSECFGGTNNFMLEVDVSLEGYLKQLSSTVVDSNLFDFTKQIASINEKVASLQDEINLIGLGHIPDFDVTSTNGKLQIDSFNNIASKSSFSATCSSGSFSDFYQDVWVPGTGSYQNYVSCRNKLSIDNTTCGADITDTAPAKCPTSRCIDAFSIIGTYSRTNGDINDLLADSVTRYGTCAPFQNFLTNFYTNYVDLVVQKIGNTADDAADPLKVAGRLMSKAKTPLTTYNSYLDTNTKALFTEVYNNLTQTHSLNSIFDPSSGMLTGLDCRVLSENAVAMKQALCITTYNRIFMTLVLVGILAFGMFLLLCCAVCFNVRHYRFSLQVQKASVKIIPEQFSSQIQLK